MTVAVPLNLPEGTLLNTASVSTATADASSADDSASVETTLLGVLAVPILSATRLAVLAGLLVLGGVVVLRRR